MTWSNRFLPLVVTTLLAGPVQAGPSVLVGTIVRRAERISMDQVDHEIWNVLLQKYVDHRGMVDYTRWQSASSDVELLDRYLKRLSAASLRDQSSSSSILAFWINAYNAVTLRGILREYPTSSIRNHTARVFGYNIWKDLKLQIDDRQVSLDDIEHKVLRKLGEPRMHFTIVCASMGCPRLLNEAYTSDRISQQLVDSAKAFFADPNKFRYDPARGTVYLSPILSWFGADFGRTQVDQLKAIAPYVPSAAASALNTGRVKVRFLDYDWNLNDQKTAR